MRAALLTVIGLVLAAGSAAAQDKALIDKGMKVYADSKCSVCHSIDGKGQAKGPLDGVGLKYSEAEMRDWMVKPAEMSKKINAVRKPPMRAYPNMSKEDLDALVAYMMTLKKK